MAMDYGAKEAANFAEGSLEHWTNFKMTLHVEITALKIHRYNYENKKNKSLSGLQLSFSVTQ